MNAKGPEQRETRYDVARIGVTVDGCARTIGNVSLSGILIMMPTRGLSVGQELHFELTYPMAGRPARLQMNGVVRRLMPGGVAVENVAPAVTWRYLLNRHIDRTGR